MVSSVLHLEAAVNEDFSHFKDSFLAFLKD